MNPFEQLANRQMVAAAKAKHKAAETRARKREVKVVQSEKDAPMVLSDREQAQADQSKQFRLYKLSRRQEQRAVAHHRTADWKALSDVLHDLTIDNGQTLVDHIASSVWLRADLHTRRVVLGLVADELIRIRLENGYPPIDDSLPDEGPTLFEIVRKQLKVLT